MTTSNQFTSPLPPDPSATASGARRSDIYGRGQHLPVTSGIEARVTQEVSGMSKPALLGYATGVFIFLFGCLGTMFNDNPDAMGIKKTIASGYLVAAVLVVQVASIADNTWRSSQKR